MTGAPAAARLDPRSVAVVVVDLQERLLPAIPTRDRILANTRLLLRAADILSLPVVVTTQYAKGLGPTAPEILAAAPTATPIDKVSFGCFGCDAFVDRLRAHPDRRQLLVAGVESHICVLQTVLGAMEADYRVHVVSDAVGARTEENTALGLRRMENAGAVLSSAEMAVYELLQRSDGAAFKKMLPHLRTSP